MATDIVLATDFAVIIVAAAIVGFGARQAGQPTIVAYILTGLLLGPAALGIATPSELTHAMGELGLAFLLFLLGIKMRIEDVKHILRPIVKISIPQMALVCLAGIVVAHALGFTIFESVLIGLAVMYSSTAVVIKMLTNKDEAESLPGKIDVGVLLVQDIVVVVLLALLATGQPDSAVEVVRTLSVILALIAAIGLVAAAASRYLLPEIFRRVADNKDVFFLVAVAWAFLFVLVSVTFELSIEMGAFLAGLSIAQLPYSTELQDRINPLTDLFMLIFFVSIGLQLDATDLFAYWPEAITAALVLMPVKFAVFFYLIARQDFDLETTFLGSANMIQVSEFGLLVGAVAVAGGFVGEPVLGFLSLVALLTMGVSVYIIKYNHALYEHARPFFSRWESGDGRSAKGDGYRNHAIVIGYDELTKNVVPLLETRYEDVIVIDRTIEHVEALDEAGHHVVYGDFRHANVRKQSGLRHADLVVSSIATLDVNKVLLAEAGEETTVLVEARWVDEALELYEHGAHYVVLATQLTADRLSEYLEAYLGAYETFETDIERDIERLRRVSSPEIPFERSGGDRDE